MKKKFTLILIFIECILNFNTLAQTCTVPWCTTGNSINTTDVLGGDNSNTNPLIIQTNGSTRITVAGNSNNVGIGTTTPSAMLSLDGNAARTIQMERHTTSNTAGNDLTILGGGATSGATNKGGGDLYLYSGVATGSGASKILLYTSTASSGGGSTADNTQTSKMAVMGSGYVGIGTSFTGPNSRLTVKEGSNNDAWFQLCGNNTGSASSNGLRIGVLNPSGGPYDVEIRQQENAPMKFFTNDGSSVAERMRITATGDVGIGTTSPGAKFHVDYSTSASSGSSYGSLVTSAFSGTTNANYGLTSAVNVTGDYNANYGVHSSVVTTSTTGNTNFAVYGLASNATNDDAAVGGNFDAGGGDRAFGVRAYAGSAATINYAVYAEAPGGSCTSTSTCAKAAGYFYGHLAYTGSLVPPSDASLKINVTPIANANAVITSLNPKTYQFDSVQYGFMHLPEGDQFGLIAQEVELIFPQFVKNMILPAEYDDQGNLIHPEKSYKGVDYIPFISLLLAGHQEQQQQINDLQAQLNNLPKPNNNSQDLEKNKPSTIEVELSNQNKIILDQNDPNPFADNTTINYFIPDNVSKVQMMFYDNSGTILKTVDIKEKGAGSIMVYGSNLASGTYSYTLLADGKVIETKKMMKMK